jgi:hypothetical protein
MHLQLTIVQRTLLQNILDAKDIEPPHVELLKRIVKELTEALSQDHPQHPHGFSYCNFVNDYLPHS